MNEQHANWLDRILDKAMFAVVADSKDEECMKMKADVNQYFNAHIEEARALMVSADADDEEEDEEGTEADEEEEV